jgi:hypothetical protein
VAEWKKAGEKLSLSLKDTEEIVKAADYTNPF